MLKLTPYYYYYFYCQEFIPYFPAKQNNTIDRENLSFFVLFSLFPLAITKRKILFKSLKEITQVYKATCHRKQSCWWQKLIMIITVPLPKRVYSPSSKTTGVTIFYSVFLLCNYTDLLEKWSVDWNAPRQGWQRGATGQTSPSACSLPSQGREAAPSPQSWARCGIPGHASHYEGFDVLTCAWSSFLYSSMSFPASFLLIHLPSITVEQLLHTMRIWKSH